MILTRDMVLEKLMMIENRYPGMHTRYNRTRSGSSTMGIPGYPRILYPYPGIPVHFSE